MHFSAPELILGGDDRRGWAVDLIMVMFTIAPMALLSAAFVFGPTAPSSGKSIERRLALGLNLVLLVLILITVVPLFAV